MIEIFTDGACSGNPGPGGYGVILRSADNYKELSEGFRKTTNNRMELLAVIVGLEALTQADSQVTVYSDSTYVVDAINKGWLDSWVKSNFKKKKNPDLWKRFLEIKNKHDVKFVWIRGHSDHFENERCDELAVAASLGFELDIDTGYENSRLM